MTKLHKSCLILSGIAWDDTYQRHQLISESFIKLGFEVTFIENIVSSAFSLKKLFYRLNTKNGTAIKRNNRDANLKVIPSGFVNPNGGIFALYNFSKERSLIHKIDNHYDVVIVYVPVRTTIELLSKIKYDLLIYDCVRDFENWGGYPKNLVKIENRIIKNSDFILTDSYYLTNKIKKKKAGKVRQLLPTVSGGMLKVGWKKNIPNIIKDIGYMGTIDSHIDINCLKLLIKLGYRVHLFGVSDIKLDIKIIDHGYFNNFENLAIEMKENVDALIIPYNQRLDGVIPAKTMQCLAMGMPVFVRSFYDADKLSDYFYVYDSVTDLINIVQSFSADEFARKRGAQFEFVNKNLTEMVPKKLSDILMETKIQHEDKN